MAIDLGDNPVGQPPSESEALQIKSVLELDNVENVALSTWEGSENLSLSASQVVDFENSVGQYESVKSVAGKTGVVSLSTSDVEGLGTAAAADLIDEDDMASDSATKVPSQQSVKAYVDNNIDTTETILDKLKGVENDPDYIGQEYLPQVIEGRFQLADGTGTVIAANQMALVNGAVAIGDGVTLEGTLLAPRIERLSQTLVNGDITGGKIIKLAAFPVSYEALAALKQRLFEIDLTVNFISDTYANSLTRTAALQLGIMYSDFVGAPDPVTSFGTASDPQCVFIGLNTATDAYNWKLRGILPIKTQFTNPVPGVLTPSYTVHAEGSGTGTYTDLARFEVLTFNNGTGVFDITAGYFNNTSGETINTEAPSSAASDADDCSISVFLKIPADAGFTGTANIVSEIKSFI